MRCSRFPRRRSRRIEHSRVSARGQFLPERTLFLDNKTLRGIAGYHVLTPLRIEGGDLAVLVNRGWIAAGDRRTLPKVATPAGTQTIEGVASVPSRRFVELAPDTAAGPLKQNLVLEQAEKQLALRLQPFVIQQTSDTPDGLQRVWARPDTGVDRHSQLCAAMVFARASHRGSLCRPQLQADRSRNPL